MSKWLKIEEGYKLIATFLNSIYHNTYYVEFVHIFIMALLCLIILPFLLLFSSKHECQKGNNLSWNPSLERNGYKEW